MIRLCPSFIHVGFFKAQSPNSGQKKDPSGKLVIPRYNLLGSLQFVRHVKSSWLIDRPGLLSQLGRTINSIIQLL